MIYVHHNPVSRGAEVLWCTRRANHSEATLNKRIMFIFTVAKFWRIIYNESVFSCNAYSFTDKCYKNRTLFTILSVHDIICTVVMQLS